MTFMTKVAICAATPQFAISTLLHENIHDMILLADPQLVMPRSYSVVRRAMTKLLDAMRTEMKSILHNLLNRITCCFDIW
jgi:hypothetical protein